MNAMILAAGLGKRMRPLTLQTPKPLLKVQDRYLIDFHLERLTRAGIHSVVINTHWLAEQLPEALGTGESRGLNIAYSHEPELLETAGGIIQALPKLSAGDAPFLVINGDVFTELDLTTWLAQVPVLDHSCQAYLALVPNPDHHPKGDFGFDAESHQVRLLGEDSLDDRNETQSWTYSGIALFHPAFFEGLATGPRALGPLLKEKVGAGLVQGSVISEYWLDVGTRERLETLQARLASQS